MATKVAKVRTSVPKQDIHEYCIVPPDGGWGWLVVIAAFYINFLIDGVIFTYGIFMNEIMEHYNVQMPEVSLIGSLMFGFHLAGGPLCTLLTRWLGVRPTVSIGAALTSLGLATSYFNPPFLLFTFLFGVVAGLGMAFAYLPSITITTIYFKKYRLLAVSIVVCGTGVGTMIFSMTGNVLLQTVGWQMTTVILGGFSFLMFPCGLIFRPLEPVRLITAPRTASISSIGTLWDDEEDQDKNIVVLTDRPKSTTSSIGVNEAAELLYEQMVQEVQVHRTVFRDDLAHWCRKNCPCCHIRPKPTLVDASTIQTLDTEKKRKGWSQKQFAPKGREYRWKMAKKSLSVDWTYLTSLNYILFTLSGSFASASMMIVYQYEIKRSLSHGHSLDVSNHLLTILGGSNLIWRLVLGMVSYLPKVNYHALNILAHVMAGGSALVSGFSADIRVLYIHCVIFGMGLAAFAVFRPVVLVELVGTEKLAEALGITLVFYGVFGTLGPPAAGMVLDITGNYSLIFWVAGVLYMLSGILMVFITGSRPKINVRRRSTSAGTSRPNN